MYYINLAGDSSISEFARSADNPDLASTIENVLLTIDQPDDDRHKGGMIAFGPDGFLYIATGDGGLPKDADGNGQNRDVLLGKILRIDVDNGTPYLVPASNPFFGDIPGRDEIFAYGFRNPWRFSFDRGGSHRLFCADVGERKFEEVDIVVSGGNYGWSIMEGPACFTPAENCDMTGLIPPIYSSSHTGLFCSSITGGYVYRGANIPWLVGHYVFTNYCTGNIEMLTEDQDSSWTVTQIARPDMRIPSFGEDDAGELYVCRASSGSASNGGVLRLNNSSPPHDLTGSWGTAKSRCRTRTMPQCTINGTLSISAGPSTTSGTITQIYLSDNETLEPASDTLVTQYDTGKFGRNGQIKRKAVRARIPNGINSSGKHLIALLDANDALPEVFDENNTVVSPALP